MKSLANSHAQAYLGVIILLMISSLALATDPAVVFVCYQDADTANALGCGCAAATRVPFADGTNMCIMWDANHASSPGPDTADVQISQGDGYGESNFGCTSFNGPDVGLTTGFFCFDPGLAILSPVPPDSSWYYIKICATSCQWYSASFHVLSGPSDVNLTPSDWTCSDSGCSFGADSESSTSESDENAMNWTFEDLMLGDSARGLTIYFDPAANELILRWPSVCRQAYQAYNVYSSASADGPFTTLVATTTNTSLTLSLPSATKQFYTVEWSWDQIGIDHNRGMSYVCARLIPVVDSTWTVMQCLDSAKTWAYEFLRDSMELDSELLDSFMTGEIDTTEATFEEASAYLDSLVALKVVSAKEELYIDRLLAIVYLDTLLSDSTHEDSLEAFQSDVLAVQWDDCEIFCLAFTSVAIHSWHFQYELVIPERGRSPYYWGGIGRADLKGALFGALTGNLVGAVGGALVGSTLEFSRQHITMLLANLH